MSVQLLTSSYVMKTASPVVILGDVSSNTGSCGKVMDEDTLPLGGGVWEKKMYFLYVAVHSLQTEGFHSGHKILIILHY